MRVLGIDPGTRIVGYGIVDDNRGALKLTACGAIDARGCENLGERLGKIYKNLSAVIKKYKPDVAVIEKVFFAKSADSAIKIGEGRGVAILAVSQAKIPLVEYAATMIKKSVTGTGSAQKLQVQNMVKIMLGLSAFPELVDASDALAGAICHCHRIRFGAATEIKSKRTAKNARQQWKEFYYKMQANKSRSK